MLGTHQLKMALAGLLSFILPVSMSVNSNCDYYQNMVLGQRYYIYNKEYPSPYPSGTSCRWQATSPENTRIVFSCDDIDIPPANQCQGDRLSVSLSGNSNFEDAHNYCGQGTLSLVSNANRIAIGLFATSYSQGGRLSCTITAVQSEQTTTTTTERPASCDCGWRQTRRIVGGVETGVNEYPSMSALIDLPNRNLYCGSTIISNRYALTAAHCVINRVATNLGLLVGDHDISTGSETNAAALYVLERFIIHPDYDTRTEWNDIAVVRTQNVIKFSIDVGPVCLPFRYSDASFTSTSVTALGWGTLDFSGPKSNTLQSVNLTVISNTECREKVTNNPIYSTQICTFAPGKDACQSDSGGPLMWVDSNRRLQLVGVISYGLGCATSIPGVNTRVTQYLSWIVSVTSDAQYCIK